MNVKHEAKCEGKKDSATHLKVSSNDHKANQYNTEN